ncbi:MAG: DUF4241 domain-containing protein [Nibricoccus sp.]
MASQAQRKLSDIKSILSPHDVGARACQRFGLKLSDVGLLKITSGQLYVVDPGFMHPTLLSKLVKGAPVGESKVKITEIARGDNSGMPAFLVVLFDEVEKAETLELAAKVKLRPGELQGHASVDSGEICVINAEAIPNDETMLFRFGDSLVKQRPSDKLAVIDTKIGAVVAKSGNGDGSYPVYWLTSSKGAMIALLIDFENW